MIAAAPTIPTPTLAASIFDWLLGLKRLSTGDDRAQLGWRVDVAGWIWIIIILAAVGLAFWSYSKLTGSRPARTALATLRALLLLLLAALIAGPMLVVEDYRLDPDWLLVLVDRSASMKIRDVVDDTDQADAGKDGIGGVSLVAGRPPITRDESLRRALGEHADLFSTDKLGKDRRIIWLGFDSLTREIDSPTPPASTDSGDRAAAKLPDPAGNTTAIRSAIEQALQRATGRPVSGIVLFTDGRTPQATGADLVAKLKQQRIGVYAVPLGSPRTPLNLVVSRVESPERAYINDTVPVTVSIDTYPQDAALDRDRLSIRLVEKQTGRVLDEKKGKEIDLGGSSAPGAGATSGKPVRLSTETAVAGRQSWRVELVYDAPADAPIEKRELVTDDNAQDVNVELVDKPIRVLYVEGYPRWEYRYLKTLLIREKSIDSSMMLISADRTFAQEGDSPITRLPVSPEEFKPYDVIIIGDVPANFFSAEQLALMKDHVSARGAGLIWIGGDYATPRSYDNTPLAELLPMRRPGEVKRADPSLGTISLRPQPLAEALNVLRLRSESVASGAPRRSEAQSWPANLPQFLWAQDIGRLKPTAEVLAASQEFPDLGGGAPGALPLVSRIRYGGGQAVYVASDETWRWRYGRGELYFQQFWIQIIRMLGRERLQQRDERVYLQVSNRRVQSGQQVKVSLHVRDAQLARDPKPRISIAVTKADNPKGPALDRIDLTPVGAAEGSGADGAGREYSAVWQANVNGDLVLRVLDASMEDAAGEPIEIIAPDDELRQPATDHPRLQTLADETGGKVVALSDLDQLNTLIPRRATRTPNDIREALWDSPLAMLLVVLLITAEWIGRKVIRLV